MELERRKRHFYRRLTKILSWITGISLGSTALIILAVLVGITIYVRTDSFQNGLRDRVLEIARTELDASITFESARVDVFSFEPKIHLQSVKFVNEKKKVGIEIERISVGISVFSLPLLAFQQLVLSTAEVQGLRYAITDTKTLNRWADVMRPRKGLLPSRFQTSIQRIILTDVIFEVALSEQDIFKRPVRSSLIIESAQVGLSPDQTEISGLMSLNALEVDGWGPYDAQLILDRALIRGPKVSFRKLQLRRDLDNLEFSGQIQNIESPILDIRGSTQIDLGFYFQKFQLEGALESEFNFKGPWNKLEGDGKTDIGNMRWQTKRLERISAAWKLADNKLSVGSLSWKDGEEIGSGQAIFPFSKGEKLKLELEFSKLDLHSYLPLVDESLKNWRGTTEGSLQFDGIFGEGLSGRLSWEMKCKDFEIRSFGTDTKILEMVGFDLKGTADISNEMRGQAQVSMQTPVSSWQGSADFTKSELNFKWDSSHTGGYFGKLFDYDIRLLGALPGTLNGPWGELVMVASPKLKSVQLNNQRVTNLHGNLRLEKRSLLADPLIADELSATGGIHFSKDAPDKFENLRFRVREIDFQEIFGFMNVEPEDIFDLNGSVYGSGVLTGPLLRPNGSGSFIIDEWAIGERSGKAHKARGSWAASQGIFYADDFEVFVGSDQTPLRGDLTADSDGLLSVSMTGKRVRLSDWMFIFNQDVNVQSLAILDLEYQREIPSLRFSAELTETSFAGVGKEDSTVKFNWIKNKIEGSGKIFGDDLQVDFNSEQDSKSRSSHWKWKLSKLNVSPWLPFFEDSRLEAYCSGHGEVSMLQKVNPEKEMIAGLVSDLGEYSGVFEVLEAGVQRTQLVLQKFDPFKIVISKTPSGWPRYEASKIKVHSGDRLLTLSGFYESARSFQISTVGATDLRALAGLNPVFARSEGVLDVDGRFTEAGFTGRAKLAGGLLTFQNSNIVVKEVGADLRADQSNFELVRLNGNFREGTMSASGKFRLTRTGVEKTKLGIQLDHILLQPETGVSLRASGPLDLIKNDGPGEVSGKLFINDGLFRRRVDLRSDLMKFFENERRTFTSKDAEGSDWKNWRMNVQLVTADPFAIRNNIGEGAVNFNLAIRGTSGDPRLVGNMDIQRGQFSFNGRQFTIQSGAVQFQNPDSNVPNYDIRADTEVGEYRVSMKLQGGPGSQKILYSSEPYLSEKDIISLISFGIPSSSAELKGQDQTRSVSFTGLSFVTGGLQDKIESRLSQDLGIQRFQLGPSFFEETGRAELQFTVGTDLIRNKLAVNYSNFISAAGGHRVELDFRVNRNVSLIGSWRDVREEQGKTGENTDDFGGDLRFRFEFE